MRYLSLFSITLLFIFITGCQNQSDATTIPTFTQSPTSAPTVTPQATLVSTIEPTQISSIQFPEWVKNPSTQIFLASTGTFEEGYKGLALFNAETSDRFDIPLVEQSAGYFWTPDGSEFGFVQREKNQITFVSVKEGNIRTIPTSASAIRFYQSNRPEPVDLSSLDAEDSNFLILPAYMQLSPDKKYFIYQEEYDNTYTSIFDISLNQTINISDPNDGYFDFLSEWSPNSQFLAIAEADRESGGSVHVYSFETLPTIRLRIYDVSSQQVVASYKDVTFPKWSPDGTKFLFQELRELDHQSWYGESPPCIFDIISGTTKCYNETITYHKKSADSYLSFSSVQWSPVQTMIGYIYSTGIQSGFCTITLSSGEISCILEKLETEEQNIIEYAWSPDSNYIAFEYDTVGPYSDDTGRPQAAIANIKTGKYFTIGDNMHIVYIGLWRPLAKP